MNLFRILVTLFSITFPVSARLGESRAQCITRYGEPLSGSSDIAAVFVKAGYQISVVFGKDKAEAMEIRKIEKNALGASLPLTSSELETLLKANGGGKEWKPTDAQILEKSWQTEDVSATATYSMNTNNLRIFSKIFMDRSIAEAAAKEKENLKGF